MDEWLWAAGGSTPIAPPVVQPSPPKQQAPKAGCTYYDGIPFKTVDTPSSTMKTGQTEEVGGFNGTRKVCTDNNGHVISEEVTRQPMDRIRYYGTYTSVQAMGEAERICLTKIPAGMTDSTYWERCVNGEFRRLWR